MVSSLHNCFVSGQVSLWFDMGLACMLFNHVPYGRANSNKFSSLLFVSAPLKEQKVLRVQQANAGDLQRRAGDPQEDGAGQEAAGLGPLSTYADLAAVR